MDLEPGLKLEVRECVCVCVCFYVCVYARQAEKKREVVGEIVLRLRVGATVTGTRH